MKMVTNLNDTSAKYTKIIASPQDNSKQTQKVTANTHEYGDKSE